MLDFLANCTDLVAALLYVPFLNLWFFPMLALAFLASVPCIIRYLTTWR